MAGKRSAVYGAIVDQRGNATPVTVDNDPVGLGDKAGYEPERLDPVIGVLIHNAESGAALLQRYTPALAVLMERVETELKTLLTAMKPTELPNPDAEVPPKGMGDGIAIALDLANKVSIILERLNKMTLNAVKSKDDATRLRTFLATGDEEGVGGLENLSEDQLRRIVIGAASGWTKTEEPAS